MPREAHGTVVQLAETHGDPQTRAELLAHVARARAEHARPRWWVDPRPQPTARATLRRVVLRTPALPTAVAFFAGILAGRIVDERSATRADLVWPGGRAHRPRGRGDGAGRRPPRGRGSPDRDTCHRAPASSRSLLTPFAAHQHAHGVVHGLVGQRELHAACRDQARAGAAACARSAPCARPR